MAVLKIINGTAATILSTELNSLASNTYVVSSVINSTGIYNNTAGSGSSSTSGDGYVEGYVLASLASSTVSANASLFLWWIKSLDGGSTFEDANTNMARSPDVTIPLENVTSTAQKVAIRCSLPGCYFKVYALNSNSNSLASSGNTVTLLPYTQEMV